MFDYLPLLSRIKSWVADEEAWNHLFSYHGQTIGSVQSAPGGDVHRLQSYENYFDRAFYRRIVNQRGGYEAVKHDIFISLSTDGFQTSHNNSYDCRLIAALNYT